MGKLQDKVAIITGGISGIGAATAELFAKEGAKLVLVDVNKDKGQEFSEELKTKGYENVIFMDADVTDAKRTQEVVDKAVEEFGSVDILIANAGIGWPGPTEDFPYEDYKKIVDIDLNGVFLYDQLVIRQMLKQEDGGTIVNCASMYGTVGAATSVAYTAAKGGVVNMTRSLGLEYAQKNIRVNTMCPGFIDTPILEEDAKAPLVQATPMARLGKAEEIAQGMLFLASDDSSFMTGQSLVIDGGYTAQ